MALDLQRHRERPKVRLAIAILLLVSHCWGQTAVPHRRTAFQSTNPSGLTVGLVAWWGLDETSDQRVDLWSTNHVIDIGPVGYATGVIGNAADFEYSDPDDCLRTNDCAALSLSTDTPFTFSAWILLESAGTRPIISKSTDSGNGTEYTFSTTGSSSPSNLMLKVGNGSSYTSVFTNSILTNGVWSFVVAFHDPDSNKIGLSVDGGEPVTVNWTGGTQHTSSACEIGRLTYSTSFTFDGLIDELAFWKRTLSLSEIQAIMAGGRPF